MSGAFDSSDNKNQARNEAIEALTALGYSPTDALKTIKQIEITDDMDSGAILKAALKVISRL
jgi:Holliday junction DNA helicase RuvA